MTKLYFTCICEIPVNDEKIDKIADLIADSGYDHYGFEDIKTEQLEFACKHKTKKISGYAHVSKELARLLAKDNIVVFHSSEHKLTFDIAEQEIGEDDITYIAENKVANMTVEQLRNYVTEDLIMNMSQNASEFWKEFINLSHKCEVTLNSGAQE